MNRSVINVQIFSVALAVFAMLFGSGNVVFPLELGRDTGNMALYAMAGFFVTAVFVPLLGVITMVLYDGKYKLFFDRIGHTSGFLVTFLCMILIGPFCIIPRSICLAYSSLACVFPALNPYIFNPLTVFCIYLLTVKRSNLLAILGKVLGPIKLALFSSIIIKGFLIQRSAPICDTGAFSTVLRGMVSGYGTLDLIGTIFFTGMILAGLRAHQSAYKLSNKDVLSIAIRGGSLGALLLGVVYSGFVLVASFYSDQESCIGAQSTQLLGILARELLGGWGGALAAFAIAIACLTTALSLTSVFADYLQKDVFRHQLAYRTSLILTLAVALIISFYGFDAIMNMILPVISVLYPALIALSLANLIYIASHIDISRPAFFITLSVAIVLALSSNIDDAVKQNYLPAFFTFLR